MCPRTHKGDMAAPTTLTSPNKLLVISVLGLSLLWGVMLCNGTLDTLFLARGNLYRHVPG